MRKGAIFRPTRYLKPQTRLGRLGESRTRFSSEKRSVGPGVGSGVAVFFQLKI